MHVNIDISKTAEEQLTKVLGPDLELAVKEALLINSYRTGRISLGFLTEVLGLPTRFDGQQWLAERGVSLNYDLDDLEADRETTRRYFHVEI